MLYRFLRKEVLSMKSSNEGNPEFETYRQLLMRERRFERVQGWILTLLGAVFTLLLVVLLLRSFQAILVVYGLLGITVIVALMVSFVAILCVGISSLRQAARIPAVQEIMHTRRFYRTRLLQQAQGRLPWSYRRSGQIVLATVGILLLIMAGFLLYASGLQAWDAWLEGVCGLLLALYALLVIPYERRRLPRESAETLANALVAGEVTEGVPLEQEEE